VAIVGAAVLGVSQIPAAAAPLSSGPGHHASAQTPDIQYPCSPLAEGDDVHISSTLPTAASGHGWWRNNDCNESYGYVCVTLKEDLNGTWYNKASHCASVPPGSSHKVGARKDCSSSRFTYWHSLVTVNTSGPLGYGFGSTYTPVVYIPCRA
jgi:hypothetical protein